MEKGLKRKLKCAVACLVLLFSLIVIGFPLNVESHSPNPTFSAEAERTPLIDGRISPSVSGWGGLYFPPEWDGDAASVGFTLTYGSEYHSAVLYVKNDRINLYLALRIIGEDYSDNDRVRFKFDSDHDGTFEDGDNVVTVYASNWYYDMFIGEPLIRYDTEGGGTNDGIGASGFVWFFPFVYNYEFEVAFPLNTADNDHDFSLGPGDTIGFQLTFIDDNAGASVTWPESGVADITVAGTVLACLGSCPPAPDLTISQIEVTQSIQDLANSLPLVRGKTTAVRVYVDIGSVSGPIDVTVYLYGISGDKTLGRLPPQSFSAPASPNRGNKTHTANFLLYTSYVDRDTLTLVAFVKAQSNSQSETNFNNNWMTRQSFTFQSTAVPNIYIIPVSVAGFPWPSGQPASVITEVKNYFRTVMPVASVNFPTASVTIPTQPTGTNINTILSALKGLEDDYGLEAGDIDQIFGIIPNIGGPSGVSDPLWGGGNGVVSVGFYSNLKAHQEGIMAHEIDHNWGPGTLGTPDPNDSWGRHVLCSGGELGTTDDWPYPTTNIQQYGFDTLLNMVVNNITPDFMTYCKAPNSRRTPGTPVTNRPQWISPYRWSNIFVRLDPPGGFSMSNTSAIQQVEETLIISGWVSQNGTGNLDPIFRRPGMRVSSSIPGNYSLILQDENGTTLLTHSFQAQFIDVEGEKQDPYYFKKWLPHKAGTARVLLMHDNATVLDIIEKSQHPPEVTVVSPNGGELWLASAQLIEWNANDADSDNLTYKVYYSPDNGITWTPLSLRLIEKSFEVDASNIPGSDKALIKVVASDGFNVGQDISDNIFIVKRKPPTADIYRPVNASVFNMDETILLEGSGTDVDDQILPETAYNWTSDIEGYLGSGDTLITTLSPGIHQITLAVTDSAGWTATDTVTITVMPTIDLAIAHIAPYKTVVAPGSTLPIDIIVENQGYTIENVTVTLHINRNPVQTQTIVNLTSISSKTLTFAWNTSGFAKGNYTLSATVNTVPNETNTADNTLNGEIIISKLGDLNMDDVVNYKDASMFRQAYIGEYNYLADFNRDGTINYKDASLFRSYYIAG